MGESPWYLDKWKELVTRHERSLGFIQVGKSGFDTKDIGIPCPKTTIRQTMSLIWVSDIFVGFDSALAHIATAFQKPTAVLWDIVRKNDIEEPFQKGFGPSALTRWSYPQNRNLMMLGEREDEILDQLSHFIIEQMERQRLSFGFNN